MGCQVTHTDSDNDCVAMCLNGHPEAFRHIVARYDAALVSYLAGRLRDRDRAEETAEEAFARAFMALRGLRKPESIFSWLVGIADRVLKEEARHARRRFELTEDFESKAQAAPAVPDYDLEQKVAALPMTLREVVLLRFYGGLSCSEVSQRLGIPIGTVTKRLSRAYENLRESLAESGHARRDSEVLR